MTSEELREILEHRRTERKIRNRILLCVVLSTTAFVVFITNKYLTTVQKQKTQITARQEVEAIRKNIKVGIDTVLERFGIRKEWISGKSVQPVKTEFTRYEERVSISPDIPVADLNLELTALAHKCNANAIAVEDPTNRITTIHISSKGTVLESVILSVNSELKREVGAIALVIDKIDNASEEELKAMLQKSNERVTYGLTPKRRTADLFRKLANADRELLLVISIKSEDDRDAFTVSNDLPEKPPRPSLKERSLTWRFDGIMGEFGKAAGCLVSFDGQKNKAAEFIHRELNRHNKLFLQMADVVYAPSDRDSIKLDRWLLELAKNSIQKKGVIGVIPWDANIVPLLDNEMSILRKRGFEFVTVSSIRKLKEQKN
jgi:hypothetical protein